MFRKLSAPQPRQDRHLGDKLDSGGIQNAEAEHERAWITKSWRTYSMVVPSDASTKNLPSMNRPVDIETLPLNTGVSNSCTKALGMMNCAQCRGMK